MVEHATTAVFDFDGVLVRDDSTVAYLRRRGTRRPWLVAGAVPALAAFAVTGRSALLRSHASRATLRAFFVGTRLEALTTELEALGHELATTPGLPLADGVAAAAAHLADGDRVVVLSAALEPLLRGFLAGAGLEGASYAGSRLGPAPGGARMRDHNFHDRKVERARLLGAPPPWDVAYTDSSSDLPLLRNARRGVLVNPSARLSAQVRAALPDVPVTDVRWT